MKIENCELDIEGVVTAPLIIARPDDTWTEARDSGVIPDSLYRFYCSANYFSFGSAPPYLADSDHILFAYLANLVRGLRDNLVEAEELQEEILQLSTRIYTPIKKARGQDWDSEADKKQNRAFKAFVIDLAGALDMFAEVTALFFTGQGPRLPVGRASFSQLSRWVHEEFSLAALIVSPTEAQLKHLHDSLRLKMVCKGPEKDWLELLHLYRNKSTHLGTQMFSQFLLHDKEGNFYTFLPRQWPYIKEKYISPSGQSIQSDQQSTVRLLKEILTHEDIVEYSKGVRQKTIDLLEAGFSVLCDTYKLFQNFVLNERALEELQSNSEAYSFLYFDHEHDSSAT